MIFRNDAETIIQMQSILVGQGFEASVVLPENEWTDGLPYVDTNAGPHDILRVRREVREMAITRG